MKTRVIFTFLLCLSIYSFAQSSSIDFKIRNLGINVDGKFKNFTVTASFDDSGKLQMLEGKIKASSIDTGIDSRDEHLLDEDYFNVKKYEFITLKSTAITKKSSSAYTVKANLSIKGKTKKITIPVSAKKLNNSYKVTSKFEINRRDFNVGGGSFVMSKTVKLNVVHYHKL